MLESTMCWLYDHSVPTPESCELCRLVKTSSQHSVKIYTPLAKSYCATVRLSEVTRRAKTFYIEQTLFQHSRAQSTPVTQKRTLLVPWTTLMPPSLMTRSSGSDKNPHGPSQSSTDSTPNARNTTTPTRTHLLPEKIRRRHRHTNLIPRLHPHQHPHQH